MYTKKNSIFLKVNKLIVIIKPSFWFQLAIFVAPLRLYTLSSISGYNLSLFRVFLMIAIFTLIVSLVKSPFLYLYKINHKYLLLIIILILFFTIIPLLYSNYLFIGDSLNRFIIKFFGWLWILFFILCISKYNQDYKNMVRAFLLSAFLPMVVGWYQWINVFLFNKTIKLPFSSFITSSPNVMGIWYNVYFRPSGTFIEPNYFGYYLMCIFLLSISLLIKRDFSILKGYYLYLLSISSILLIFISLSLSSLVGLLFGLIYLLTITYKSFLKGKKIIFLILLIVLFSVFVFTSNFGIIEYIYDALSLKISSRASQIDTLFGRESFVKIIPEALDKSYLLGVGYGGIIAYTGNRLSTVHSAFLTIFVEQGIMAFLLIILLFIAAIFYLYKEGKNNISGSAIAIGLGSALLALVISNLAYDAMFSFDASWVLIALSLAKCVLPIDKIENIKLKQK